MPHPSFGSRPRRRRAGPSRIALALGLALVTADTLPAEWARGSATDPETGDEVEAVIGDNERGFRLVLVRDPAGGVRAIFRLPSSDRDFLAETQAPRIALDGGAARQVPLAAAGLTWAAFPVWNGAGEALTGTLRELMQAESLALTYYLNGGGYKETVFPLAGAREVIAEAFGLRAEVSVEESQRAAALEAALLTAAEQCGAEKGKKRDRCLEALRGCAGKAGTAEELGECHSAAPR